MQGEGLFTRTGTDRTRCNGFKLKEGRFRHKEEILYYEGGEAWNRLLREVVAVPYLGVFKARLDEALSNLI